MTPRTRRIGAAAVAGLALLVLAACSPQPAAPVGTWGDGADGGPQLVLDEDGRLHGTDGCNRLIGSWEQDGDRISFGAVGSTMMACPDVDTWLSGANSARVDGDVLRVHDDTGTEIGTLDRISP